MSGKHWLEEVLAELEEFAEREKLDSTKELLSDARLVFLNEIRQQNQQRKNEPTIFSYNSGDYL